MAKTKKHRLPLEPDRNYYLTAIASHEKGYHLSWLLNRELGTHFIRSADFRTTRKSREMLFPVFVWEDEKKMISWHLIANRSEHGFLLENLKTIDFLLHIAPAPGEEFSRNLEKQLKNIPGIHACFPVDPGDQSVTGTLQFD